MIDTVFRLLFRFEGLMTEKQICQVLGITKYQDFENLRKLLYNDERFVNVSSKLWKSASLEHFLDNQSLDETSFVITDIETTGSIRGKDRIIDIAAAKIKNGEVVGEFNSLVNPEINITVPIRRLTGITNKMVVNAPSIETVLPEFIDFVDDGVFVAHNASFDFNFINHEIKRLNYKNFKKPIEICSYRLAKKMVPEAASHGIVALAKFFNYKMENHHRAMPDVKATSFFFKIFLKILADRGIDDLFQLINLQKDKLSKKKLRKKIHKQFKYRKSKAK